MGKKTKTQIGGQNVLWSTFTELSVRCNWTNLQPKWPNDSTGTQQIRVHMTRGHPSRGDHPAENNLILSCGQTHDLMRLWILSFHPPSRWPCQQDSIIRQREWPAIRRADFRFQAWLSVPLKGSYTGEAVGTFLYSIHVICDWLQWVSITFIIQTYNAPRK